MTATHTCDDCGAVVQSHDAESFPDVFLAHVRTAHPDWPFPDFAVRQVGARALSMRDAPTTRLESVGEVVVKRVTADRIGDWLAFFDCDACAGRPPWQAVCYCLEPHVLDRSAPEVFQSIPWQERRSTMARLLSDGEVAGYLAYVDGRAAAWINASSRGDYSLYRRGPGADPADDDVIAIACLLAAPPYRGHGLPTRLVEHVLGDATSRGAAWVEAYPFTDAWQRPDFHGRRSLYDALGFQPVRELPLYTVMRRRV